MTEILIQNLTAHSIYSLITLFIIQYKTIHHLKVFQSTSKDDFMRVGWSFSLLVLILPPWISVFFRAPAYDTLKKPKGYNHY